LDRIDWRKILVKRREQPQIYSGKEIEGQRHGEFWLLQQAYVSHAVGLRSILRVTMLIIKQSDLKNWKPRPV